MDQPSHQPDWHSWLAASGRRFLLFARDQTRCEADAHDVMQDALVESWRRYRQGQDPPPDALVFATIRRRAIDLSRRNIRRAAREQNNAPAWFVTTEEPGMEAELEEAMKSLPADLRTVLVLKIWSELTFREIGDTLGIPQNTAASRYRYALENLRSLLKEVPS